MKDLDRIHWHAATIRRALMILSLAPAAAGATPDSTLEAGPEEEQTALDPGANGTRLKIEPAPVDIPPLKREAEESVKAVRLRKHELELTKQLGPFLGKSPRAVKKFVNLYRLLRGMRRGSALQQFLGSPMANAPNHAAVQFWLAVDCGLSSSQVGHLRAAVAGADPNAELDYVFGKITEFQVNDTDELTSTERTARREMEDDQRKRPDMWQFWKDTPDGGKDGYFDAFAAIHEALPAPNGMAALKLAMTETLRFSASL